MVFENVLDYKVAEKKSFLVFAYAFVLDHNNSTLVAKKVFLGDDLQEEKFACPWNQNG